MGRSSLLEHPLFETRALVAGTGWLGACPYEEYRGAVVLYMGSRGLHVMGRQECMLCVTNTLIYCTTLTIIVYSIQVVGGGRGPTCMYVSLGKMYVRATVSHFGHTVVCWGHTFVTPMCACFGTRLTRLQQC